MTRAILLLALFLAGLSMAPAAPAAAPTHRDTRDSPQICTLFGAWVRRATYWRSAQRAGAVVWAFGHRWSECGSYCAWGQTDAWSAMPKANAEAHRQMRTAIASVNAKLRRAAAADRRCFGLAPAASHEADRSSP